MMDLRLEAVVDTAIPRPLHNPSGQTASRRRRHKGEFFRISIHQLCCVSFILVMTRLQYLWRCCTRPECLSGRVVCGAQLEEVFSETADLLHELLLVCTAHGGFLLEPVHLAL